MKLIHIRIQNFRSCHDVSLEIGDMHAMVGANNAGKSSVLRALDFLFNPSTKSLNDESFWNKDTALEIRVEAIFADLKENEKTALSGCLKANGTFHMARSAKMGAKTGEADSDEGEDKITISQHYKQPTPQQEWLQESKINGKTIGECCLTRRCTLPSSILFRKYPRIILRVMVKPISHSQGRRSALTLALASMGVCLAARFPS